MSTNTKTELALESMVLDGREYQYLEINTTELPEAKAKLVEAFQYLKAKQNVAEYIYFKLNGSESLIRMHANPLHFWHYNLQEHRALQVVKEAVAEFLGKKVEEITPDFRDVYFELANERLARIKATMSGEVRPPLPQLPDAFQLLEKLKQTPPAIKLEKPKESPTFKSVSSRGPGLFGNHQEPPKTPTETPPTKTHKM